ncbi:MAG: DUF2147 domain-containing protein [Cyclobacteriaceae bacterium]|jgi:uncharacterized protein (DUF2147 family)
MKYTIPLLTVLIFQFSVYAQKSPDKIIGLWLNDEKTNKIEIYKVGDTYSGKIVWIAQLDKNPGFSPKDKNNPNPEKRNQSILGMDIITGLKYSKGKWLKGSIYNPQKGIYADCKVELPAETRLDLIVSKGVFSKTKTWIKQ